MWSIGPDAAVCENMVWTSPLSLRAQVQSCYNMRTAGLGENLQLWLQHVCEEKEIKKNMKGWLLD